MSEIDRAVLIAHLDALSNEDDATALNAAREASKLLLEADLNWDDVLTPLEVESEADEDFDDETDSPKIDLSNLPDDDAKLVEKLLTSKNLNDDTRDDLENFKQDIEKGDFASEDRQYLRALAGRLSSK